MIYELVLPTHEVIYVDYNFPWPSGSPILGFKICRETTEHHCRFSASLGDWHSRCYTTESQGPYRPHPGIDVAMLSPDWYSQYPPDWYGQDPPDLQNTPLQGPHRQYPSLDLALLSTCRQTYHEAKYTLYATNTFAFRWQDVLLAFIRKFGKGTAANNPSIRNINLFVEATDRKDEESWNEAFELVAQKLPGLKNVCVTVGEGCCQGFEPAFWDPLQAKPILLEGILKRRDLQLSSLVVVVAGSDENLDEDPDFMIGVMPERLSQAQKVDWANFVKSAIMGSETNVVAR